jgi:hypothetical protein
VIPIPLATIALMISAFSVSIAMSAETFSSRRKVSIVSRVLEPVS